ncbi:hypothetical protein U1Q18_022296 [Sarracenia purpurea var. burkii]
MATSHPSSKPLDLDITIVSAKHLKNVNWRHGDLTPYAIFWVDSDRRLATKSDDSGSTRPVWNERFMLPLSLPLHESFLNIEMFHSKPSETSKPLIGTLQLALKDLVDPDDSTRLRTFDLRRPSGRPQGKIRIKLAVRERPSPPAPDYHTAPPSSYYYSTAPPHPSSYGGPSAPVDYAPYDQKQRSGKMGGFGTGLAVGAAAGALGGLALEEELKREEDKIAEKVDSDFASRDDYSDYRSEYGYK